jgi:predicted phosphodiesterase
MGERRARVWFFGHTHRSRAWELTPDHAAALAQSSIDLDPARCYVVNVGTTGLPLPGRGPAGFVIYDDTAQRVEHIVLAGDKLRRQPVRSPALV